MASLAARVFAAVLVCGLTGGCASRAAQPAVPQPAVPQSAVPLAAPELAQDESERPEGDRGFKNYLLPVAEIVAADVIVNLGGRVLLEPEVFEVTPQTIRRNLRGPWVIDDDPFQVNQLGHPYQGAIYHGIARSSGLSYWPSVVYTFAGSALWEIAGETTPPSRNDQIASGVAGSFLGEPLFRVSRLLLDRADDRPGVWRKLASVLVSPPTGINNALVGRPAGLPAPDAVPFSDIRVQFGVTAIPEGRTPSLSSLAADQPRLALSIDHGYPGNSGSRHDRPFDYFRIETSISSEGFEHVSTRGLVAGRDYNKGRLNGVWGLYGSYDYFAPQDFRFSSTAFSFGTTLQASLTDSLIVQSSGLLGGGYVAAFSEDRLDDYHYGVAPQALANLRLIAGRRAALDLTAREYFVTGFGGFGASQRDLIVVGDAWLAIRLFGRHGLGLTYQLAGRSSEYLELPDRTRSRTTVGVYYTFLGSGGFGAAD